MVCERRGMVLGLGDRWLGRRKLRLCGEQPAILLGSSLDGALRNVYVYISSENWHTHKKQFTLIPVSSRSWSVMKQKRCWVVPVLESPISQDYFGKKKCHILVLESASIDAPKESHLLATEEGVPASQSLR